MYRSGLLSNIPSAALRAKLDAPNGEQQALGGDFGSWVRGVAYRLADLGIAKDVRQGTMH